MTDRYGDPFGAFIYGIERAERRKREESEAERKERELGLATRKQTAAEYAALGAPAPEIEAGRRAAFEPVEETEEGRYIPEAGPPLLQDEGVSRLAGAMTRKAYVPAGLGRGAETPETRRQAAAYEQFQKRPLRYAPRTVRTAAKDLELPALKVELGYYETKEKMGEVLTPEESMRKAEVIDAIGKKGTPGAPPTEPAKDEGRDMAASLRKAREEKGKGFKWFWQK